MKQEKELTYENNRLNGDEVFCLLDPLRVGRLLFGWLFRVFLGRGLLAEGVVDTVPRPILLKILDEALSVLAQALEFLLGIFVVGGFLRGARILAHKIEILQCEAFGDLGGDGIVDRHVTDNAVGNGRRLRVRAVGRLRRRRIGFHDARHRRHSRRRWYRRRRGNRSRDRRRRCRERFVLQLLENVGRDRQVTKTRSADEKVAAEQRRRLAGQTVERLHHGYERHLVEDL